jgi:hypothetical protein
MRQFLINKVILVLNKSDKTLNYIQATLALFR